MEFLVSALKKDRKASYGDLKAKADEKKLKIFPIMFGRAQALLGIVKSAKRGTAKAAKADAPARVPGKVGRPEDASSKSGRIRALLGSGLSAAEIAKRVGCTTALVYNVKSATAGGPKRGPGRPRKTAMPGSQDGLEGIVAAVRESERERNQLRAALERIQATLREVLS